MFRRATKIKKERTALTGKTDQPGAGTSAIHHIDHRETAIAQKKLVDAIGLGDTVQSKKNDTGLPDDLKVGIEEISGLSMDDVKVHYNSSMPGQLNAHAYA